jgi:hypothetical protein
LIISTIGIFANLVLSHVMGGIIRRSVMNVASVGRGVSVLIVHPIVVGMLTSLLLNLMVIMLIVVFQFFVGNILMSGVVSVKTIL